jgi:methylase of polypeptide subunit release factors
VLDPACGSGHMLFYAFDVLYQMYLEEGEIPEEYIPREILRNNLYGIDIDSGAVQIAALSLFLKAKEKSPSVSIPQLNIVSADTVLINGDRKQEVLDGARSELEEEILEEIWTSFDNIRERGSLVRIEEKIDEKLEEYRETFESKGQAQFTKEGVLSTQSTFVSDGREVTWENLKEQILENIQILTESALEKNDPIEEMFTGEVERSVRLLDLFLHDYDIVLSNPPYLGSAKMNDSLKGFVKEEYKGSSDLYTAFIERNLDFTSSNGYLSMITMETFMYQYSYRGMRSKILNEMNFVDAMHLENREEGYMNICFLTKRLDEENRVPSRFNRLISTDDKEGGMEEITRAERDGESDDRVFVVNQKSFEEIDRSPFVYWFGDDVLQLFTEHPSLNSLLEIKQGLCTGDDDRFIRSWWEVSREKIGKKYSWIVMGGDDSKYYYSPEKVVEWGDSQVNIKETKGSRLQNTEYYKKEGINYRDFSKYFTPRLHQKTDIFNQTTRFIPTQKSKNRMLGYLSSSLVRFIMDGLGSGLHYTVGDGKRIPVKKPTFDDTVVSELVGQAVNIRKRSDSLYETSREFSPNNLVSQWGKLLASIDINKADVEIIHGLVDRRTFDEYSISEESRTRIYDDLPANLSEYPHIINSGTLETDEFKFRTQIDTIEVSREEYTAIVEQVKENKSKSIRELAEVLEVSPYTIAFIRENTGAYSLSRKQEAAGRFLSYCIGLLMGRWEYKSYSSNNSILSLDEMMNKLDDYLSVFDDKDVARHRIESMLGQGIENWLRSEYFSEHHVSEYKRRGQRTPIYWQLNSPNDSFSCFIYYHRIDRNTLPKLRGQYLDSRIGKLEKELETLNTQINADNPDNKLLNRKEQVQNDLNDIREFRDTIDEMIDDGVTVDVEKGIWENIKEWDQYEVLETGLPKLKSSYSR